MTIFEMLEKLETEIVSLQARYQSLAGTVSHPPNGNGKATPGKRKRSSSATKKVGKTAAKKNSPKNTSRLKQTDFEQLELQVEGTAPPSDQPPARVLGKRQALGKSIVQLRKMSAWRTSRADEE